MKIALTFDDGSLDFYSVVFPILIKTNAPATLFVVGGYLDGTVPAGFPVCDRDQILEMSSSQLVEIASHSQEHLRSENYAGFEKSRDVIREATRLPRGHRIGYAFPYEAHPDSSFKKAAKKDQDGPLYIRIGKRFSRRPLSYVYQYLYKHTGNRNWHFRALALFGNSLRWGMGRRIKTLFSVQVQNHMSVTEIVKMLEHASRSSLFVLQFHTIFEGEMPPEEDRYKLGSWQAAQLLELIDIIQGRPEWQLVRLDRALEGKSIVSDEDC